MPTYEYECQKCGKIIEVFQSITAEPLKYCDCPQKGKLKRLIGAGAGIIFKGSGFYETDYRSSEYAAAAKAENDKPSAKPSENGKDAGKKSSDQKTKKSEKPKAKTKA